MFEKGKPSAMDGDSCHNTMMQKSEYTAGVVSH